MEINGEATQGITHTRAIELIQAGGNKVHLLLRPGQGLVPDHSERLQRAACLPTHCCHCTCIFGLAYEAYTYIEAFVWICLSFFIPMHVLQASLLTVLSSHSSLLSRSTFLSALVFCTGTAVYFYLFIFSSYRSELFFHPVLLHETRASLKASLLFLVCSL